MFCEAKEWQEHLKNCLAEKKRQAYSDHNIPFIIKERLVSWGWINNGKTFMSKEVISMLEKAAPIRSSMPKSEREM